MTDDELRRLAEAATPGPWKVERDDPSPDVHDATGSVIATTMHSDLSRMEDGHNAAFIAAANPAAVLALLDRLRAAEAGWQPIETAPREPYEIDVPMELGGIRRIRMGPCVMLRGEIEGEVIEAEGCWSIKNDEPGYWWNIDVEEPATWATHWRPLPAAPEPTP